MFKEINSPYKSKEQPTKFNREQHLRQVKKLVKTFADPCDGTIYHYTSAKGFQGIVESSEIWLTNTEFVNDTTECKALQKETNLFGEAKLSFNRYIEKWWQRFLKDKDKRKNHYITSFSKNPDSLEQWRAYGNICIGFDAERLKKKGFSLHECVYDKGKIKEWMLKKAEAKEWMLDDPDRTRSFIAKDSVPTTSHDDGRDGAAFSLIFRASIKLKHFCFENEKEVRLLAVSNHNWGLYTNSSSMFEKDPPIHFRPHLTLGLPVPYVKYFTLTQPEEECDSSEKYKGKTELQVKEEKRDKEKNQKRALLPIKEIIVGPTPHKEETRLACEILLQEKGYNDVKINVSEIPYRGF
ncbi:hypothetical protein ACFL3G_12470 [Planctomycetota bacterium]